MSYSTAPRPARGGYQWLALIFGAIYLVVGIVGFFVTGFDGFTEHDHSQTLLGFAINPLHNIVHLLIGVLGLGLWSTSAGARTFGWILLVGYGVTFVYGLFALGSPDINFLNINVADNWLHGLSALVGLIIAVWPARSTAVPTYGAATTQP
ncbi:DUF4383 domain-containing protein [Promicromonospora kroppenstedtii]|uniref:DUF4383 domain-containing protein n=1 Tax=Promicromonospora kroppenstedtii TaxID=440482 RepID=UPI0004AE64CC|nr:DUF4383 domain-containing protein [Promicromonospora kroppenstedtii]